MPPEVLKYIFFLLSISVTVEKKKEQKYGTTLHAWLVFWQKKSQIELEEKSSQVSF